MAARETGGVGDGLKRCKRPVTKEKSRGDEKHSRRDGISIVTTLGADSGWVCSSW